MLGIVPVISKIVQEDEAFICYDSNDDLICITTSKEIAEIYFAIPQVLTMQANTIVELKDRLRYVTEEYNNLIMGIIPSGSSLIH